MKKFCAFIAFVFLILSLSSCGNKDMLDTNYTFDRAIIKMPDGTVEEVEIEQWGDYEGEQIQIIAKDGTIYLVNSVNCVLIKD